MELNKIIGSKKIFAIEWKINEIKKNPLIGRSCIWIKGCQIGFYDEECALGPLFNSLKLIQNSLCSDADEGVFNNLQQNVLYPSFGESYDDFIIRVIKDDEYVNFLWHLSDEPFHTYADGEVFKNRELINHQRIALDYFTEKAKEGISDLSKLFEYIKGR